MKHLLILTILFVFVGCSNSTSDEPQDKAFAVTGLSATSAQSGDIVRVSGNGFDPTTTVTLSGREITLDTVTANEIVFQAPWPTGSYDVHVLKMGQDLAAGTLEVSRALKPAVAMPDGQYVALEMTASGLAYRKGFFTSGSQQIPSYYEGWDDSPSTSAANDDTPWITIAGDSIYYNGRPNAVYRGHINVSEGRVRQFTAWLRVGYIGLDNAFAIQATELDVREEQGKYILEANGNFAFDSLIVTNESGPPRPSKGEGKYKSLPATTVRIVLEKRY